MFRGEDGVGDRTDPIDYLHRRHFVPDALAGENEKLVGVRECDGEGRWRGQHSGIQKGTAELSRTRANSIHLVRLQHNNRNMNTHYCVSRSLQSRCRSPFLSSRILPSYCCTKRGIPSARPVVRCGKAPPRNDRRSRRSDDSRSSTSDRP